MSRESLIDGWLDCRCNACEAFVAACEPGHDADEHDAAHSYMLAHCPKHQALDAFETAHEAARAAGQEGE